MLKSHNSRALFFIALALIFVMTVVFGFILWIYWDNYILPIQPSSKGDFPRRPVWVYEADGTIVSSPLLYDSQLFIRSRNSIIALDPNSGNLIWKTKSKIPTGINTRDLTLAPKAGNGIVVVTEEGSKISAFSAETGEPIWSSTSNETVNYDDKTAPVDAFAISDTFVVVARNSTSLTGYDLYTGKKVWETSVPNRVTLDVQANSQSAYLGAGTILSSFNIQTGEKLWEEELGAVIRKILLDRNILYVIMPFGKEPLVAIEPNTRQVLWEITDHQLQGDELRTILLSDKIIYVGGERLYAISSRDGSINWETEKTGPLETPSLLDKNVIVRNTNKKLYLFDSITGNQVGELSVKANTPMRHEPERSPVIYNNLIILPFGDKRIFAYQMK